MRRIWATIATFALTGGATAWIALAPFAHPGSPAPVLWLDDLAARVIDGLGQGNAVLAALGLTIVLTALVALTGSRRLRHEALPAPEAFAEAPHDMAAEEEPHAQEPDLPPPPSPILLVRRPRDRGHDWLAETSWLGGLPRLGPAAWPRGSDGRPLPFVAQIDLAELAHIRPETGLPPRGWLAFFLGSGAVVGVPPGEHGFTPPPPGLPPAFDEGGFPLPARTSALSRPVFPFWPVEQIALDLTGGDREGALGAFLTERFGHYPRATFRAVEDAPHPEDEENGESPTASQPPAPPPLWWHAVRNLARRIEIAAALAPRQVAQREAKLTAALDTLDTMHREHRGTLEIDQAEDVAAVARADLDRFTEQVGSLPHMAAALVELVSGRSDWEPLNPDEVTLVEEVLAELHSHYADTVSTQIPASLAQLSTLSQRAMVSGDETALDALPDDTLMRINTEHALANLHQHRIFALDEDGRRDVLLLQLGYDDLMEWRWSEMGAWRFRIPADALREERWDKATLVFETA